MDQNERHDQIMPDVERLLAFVNEEGGAGGTIGPEGLHLGMPNWAERTKQLRPSERITTHGYPFGFAKSQWQLRDRMLVRYRQRIEGAVEGGQAAWVAAHEAVARALDWERLLGSFNHAGEDHFPVSAVDQVADNLLAWLDHQGFQVAPKENGTEEPVPEVESRMPNVFDNARGTAVLLKAQQDSRMVEAEPKDDEDGGRDMAIPNNTIRCRACDGKGCERCGGRGWLHESVGGGLGKGRRRCPFCEGAQEVGSFVMEQQCGACAGQGTVSAARYAELRRNNWEPKYSSVSEAREALDQNPTLDVLEPSLDELIEMYELEALDCSGVDFSGKDLSDQNFAGTDLTNANLDGTNLSSAGLGEADLSGATLRRLTSRTLGSMGRTSQK